MGRGKVELKQIENKTNRQITFSKRRKGLFKKAQEISVLCDAKVALIIFNTKGKLSEFSSESSSMESILEQYDVQTSKHDGAEKESQGSLSLEYHKLRSKSEVLERNLRNLAGHDLDPLSLKELQSLEEQLDTSLKRIRLRKIRAMNDSISHMRKRIWQLKAMREQNKTLINKIKNKEKRDYEWPQNLLETLNQNSSNLSPTELPLPSPESVALTLALSGQGSSHSRKSVRESD